MAPDILIALTEGRAMETDTEIVRTSLRIPKAMYDRLSAEAASKGVTMHADILTRISSTLTDEPAPSDENGSGRPVLSKGYGTPIFRIKSYTRQSLPDPGDGVFHFAVTNPEEGRPHLVYSMGGFWRYTDGSLMSRI